MESKRAGTLGKRVDGGRQWADRKRGAMPEECNENGIQAMEVSEVA